MPVIAAGLRVAAVSNVSLVAVAGDRSASQTGPAVHRWLHSCPWTAYYPPIVLGILLCVLLALVLDTVIVLVTPG